MKSIYDIIQLLDVNSMFNERYYRFEDLRRYIDDLSDQLIETEDYILTPFYIFQGKRMELYEYKLRVIVEKRGSFEDYLLAITGKKSVKDISEQIIKRNRICYIECEDNTHMIKVNYLQKYINFLLFNDDIQCQVKKYLDSYDKNNLYFEIY